MKRCKGIYLSHRKHTAGAETERLPLPATVILPMSMHMGAPCRPMVAVGDSVMVGQQIGETTEAFSAPIHASVSGKVTAIQEHLCANGTKCPAVVIESDGNQTIHPACQPKELHTKEALIEAARNSGCVGLGGAGFPTHIKLSAQKPMDMLVVNAAECEPYLTSDCRQMMESTADCIAGIVMIMKLMSIARCRIGVENNKPAAIRRLAEACREHPEIEVIPLSSMYPQGAEKVLIYHTTGRVITEGTLPADHGVLLLNISTCAFLYQYTQTGIPLVERRVTVDGTAVRKPCNLLVPISTPVRLLLEYAEYDAAQMKRLLSGGPMMGLPLYSVDTPICKPNNGLLAMKELPAHKQTACIRCGRCMRACPMQLMPMALERAYAQKDRKALERYRVMLCMNCGCCSYVCPASRPLAATNQLAKSLLSGNERSNDL
ncbi:MAG: electron transport complex subunit RsxC [Oscillospiraceae bacterium]|nr:electron transport complex subunit RsxC [Oscillospiraceae bacterium]